MHAQAILSAHQCDFSDDAAEDISDKEDRVEVEDDEQKQFSSNCREIENKVHANEDLSDDTVMAYKAEIKRLQEELGSIEGRIRAEMDEKLAAIQEEMEQWKQLAIGRERALLEARLQRDSFAAQLPGGPSNEGERPIDSNSDDSDVQVVKRLLEPVATVTPAKTPLSASEPTVSAVAKDTSSSDTNFDSDEPKDLFDGHVGQDKTSARGIALKVIKIDNNAAQTLLACEIKIGCKTIKFQWTSDIDTLVFARDLLKKNHLNLEYDAVLVFQLRKIIELLYEGRHRLDGLVLTTLIERASECVPAPPDLKVLCEVCGEAVKAPVIQVTTSKKRKYLYPLSRCRCGNSTDIGWDYFTTMQLTTSHAAVNCKA